MLLKKSFNSLIIRLALDVIYYSCVYGPTIASLGTTISHKNMICDEEGWGKETRHSGALEESQDL